MPPYYPDIPALHECGLGQRGIEVIIIIRYLVLFTVRKQVVDFIDSEACQAKVEVRILQCAQFNPQQFLVPPCVHRHSIVRKNVRLLLRLGHVIHKDTRDFLDSLCLCRQEPPVSGNHIIFAVNDDGIDKAKLPQRGAKFQNLLIRVRPCVICIRNQL